MLKALFVFIVYLIFSFSASAALVDNDAYTTDTQTGLRWLDFTATQGMSYNQVTAEIQSGTLSGWRYATTYELETYFLNQGLRFNLPESSILTTDSDTVAKIIDLMGATSITTGAREAYIITGSEYIPGKYFTALISDGDATSGYVDLVDVYYDSIFAEGVNQSYGSALVSVVPLPPALWLFAFASVALVLTMREEKRYPIFKLSFLNSQLTQNESISHPRLAPLSARDCSLGKIHGFYDRTVTSLLVAI